MKTAALRSFLLLLGSLGAVPTLAFAVAYDGTTQDPNPARRTSAQADEACAQLVAHVANKEPILVKDNASGKIRAVPAAASLVVGCRASSQCQRTVQELTKRGGAPSDLQCAQSAGQKVAANCVEEHMGAQNWFTKNILKLQPGGRCMGSDGTAGKWWPSMYHCEVFCE